MYMDGDLIKGVAAILAVAIGIINFIYSRFRVEIEVSNKITEVSTAHEDTKSSVSEAKEQLRATIQSVKEDLEGDIRHTRSASKEDLESYKAFIKDELTELRHRLINTEAYVNKVSVIETKVEIFWEVIREHAPRMLMHHDDITRDKLIAKLKNRSITGEEARELKALLEVDLAHMQKDENTGKIPDEWWPTVLELVDAEYAIRGYR